MRILITNDDGMHATQLVPLIQWCQKLGQITVVVPKVEQSGKSHGIELRQAFEAKQVELAPGIIAWAVDSTPADCVRFAVLGMKMEFDLVISGINRGLNVGTDILYSGTVSAILEAANLGIQGIALSTTIGYYEQAVTQLDRVQEYFQNHKLLEKGNIYNVNIPADAQSIRITRQGGSYYSDEFPPVGNDMYEPKGIFVYKNQNDLTLDTDSVMSGHISVMPLSASRLDAPLYEELKKLNN